MIDKETLKRIDKNNKRIDKEIKIKNLLTRYEERNYIEQGERQLNS